MIFLFLFVLFLSEAFADVAVPGPQYAKEELGPPRLPPYIFHDWIWMIPIAVLGILFAAMIVIRKRQNTKDPQVFG